jgi:ankyrin repeat protein
VEEGNANVNKANVHGETPLIVAVQKNKLEVVKFLVQEGKAHVNQATNSGMTPLYVAASMGQLEIVQWLIDIGDADVEQAVANGTTPLFVAIYKGDVEMVQWLVQEGEANINHTKVDGVTPLHFSLKVEAFDVAVPQILLSAGARVPSTDVFKSIVTKGLLRKEVRKLEVLGLFVRLCCPSQLPLSSTSAFNVWYPVRLFL